MAHKDICIKFEVEGEPFEAVGVLADGEPPISGDTMLERVPDAIGEEWWVFLSRRTDQFPAKLCQYCLATAWRLPNSSHLVSSFLSWRNGGRCYTHQSFVGYQWDDSVLVLRRGKKATLGTETT